MNNNILGRNIRKARLKKGWTQKQFLDIATFQNDT
jgi:transcriptional regulator with XRE-family HTH domain